MDAESEPNERELLAMERMLRRGNGSFVLAFAHINILTERERRVTLLRDMLAPSHIRLSEVTLSGLNADIYDELAHAEGAGSPLFVYGLERVMPSADPYRALAQLNERRGRYQELARPLVFWVPTYVLRLIANQAPDFWSWRSGVYEFADDPTALRQTYEREMAVPYQAMTGLNHADKEARVRLLTALLDDYAGNTPETKAARANVLSQLGQMYLELGDYSFAEQCFQQSISLSQELDDPIKVAVAQRQLADMYAIESQYRGPAYLSQLQLDGDYEQAEEFYLAKLQTAEVQGDRHGVAVTQKNFALMRIEQGRWAEALELLEKTRNLFQQLHLEKDVVRVEEMIQEVKSHLAKTS